MMKATKKGATETSKDDEAIRCLLFVDHLHVRIYMESQRHDSLVLSESFRGTFPF